MHRICRKISHKTKQVLLRETHLVQLGNLAGVTVEQLKEGSLRARSALRASELETLTDSLNIFQIHHELLDPLGSTFPWVC